MYYFLVFNPLLNLRVETYQADRLAELEANTRFLPEVAVIEYISLQQEIVRTLTQELAASQAQLEISNTRNAYYTRELEGAAKVQRSILTETLPVISGWTFGILYKPAHEMSGDSYRIFPAKSPNGFNRIGIVTFDVADKGFGPGIIALLASTLTQTISNKARAQNPEDVVRAVHFELIDKLKGNLDFVTALLGLIDFNPKDGSAIINYARSGNWPPQIWRDRQYEKLPTKPSLPLGRKWNMKLPVDVHSADIGDLVILTTDGVMDTLGGIEELDRIVQNNWDLPADELCNVLDLILKEYPQEDDYTLVAVKRAKN